MITSSSAWLCKQRRCARLSSQRHLWINMDLSNPFENPTEVTAVPFICMSIFWDVLNKRSAKILLHVFTRQFHRPWRERNHISSGETCFDNIVIKVDSNQPFKGILHFVFCLKGSGIGRRDELYADNWSPSTLFPSVFYFVSSPCNWICGGLSEINLSKEYFIFMLLKDLV